MVSDGLVTSPGCCGCGLGGPRLPGCDARPAQIQPVPGGLIGVTSDELG